MDGARSGMDKLIELVGYVRSRWNESAVLSELDPASFGQLELEFAAPDQRILDGDFLLVNINKVPAPEADTRGKEEFNCKEAKPETCSAAQDDEEVDDETDGDEEVDDETDDEEVDETDDEEVDDETDDEEVDEKYPLRDIELVMRLAEVSRSKAAKAPRECDGDNCSAIIFLNETGLEPKDIELVMAQADVSRSQAAEVLRECDGDLVSAILCLDETGLEPRDIELVMVQAGVSRSKAVNALRDCNGEIVSAIMDLA